MKAQGGVQEEAHKPQIISIGTSVEFESATTAKPQVQTISCEMNTNSKEKENAASEAHTTLCFKFVASDSLEEGLLDGMFSQVLEGVLSEQEFQSSFETSVEPGPESVPGSQAFCVQVKLSLDAFEKASITVI